MPDGCINLVINLGENIRSIHFDKQISHEGIFFVGTTLRPDEQVLQGESRLFGIQFKPGAFTYFYKWDSLNNSANQVLEFDQKLFPDIKKTIQYFIPYVDQFYLDRLSHPRSSIMSVVADIEQHGHQFKIEVLAKRHYTTARQLERQFNQHIGISPKEFMNLTRFKNAFEKIQLNRSNRSLSDIAWECGYYDHAHLTNDFKRYTGATPSTLILSDFSKTIASDPW